MVTSAIRDDTCGSLLENCCMGLGCLQLPEQLLFRELKGVFAHHLYFTSLLIAALPQMDGE